MSIFGAVADRLDAEAARARRERADLITLTAWMAAQGYSAQDLAYAVEKPHKYAAELAQAQAALEQP